MEKHLSPEIIITCEHAGNFIPEGYRHLFVKADEILNSHRGWDPGALSLAKFLSDDLNAPIFTFSITRLLIEVNRSLGHRRLFSEFSKFLSAKDKKYLIENYYGPYRNEIEAAIRHLIQSGKKVIHIGVHTFTPVFRGKERACDIGILFDPAAAHEKQFSRLWKQNLESKLPHLTICHNQPYRGVDDGLTTHLREVFNSELYVGIELEVNQKLLTEAKEFSHEFSFSIAQSLSEITKLPA
ncbi:N-formylglutamate amidohydrolase [Rhodohalobacter halophilus]|uniref:N-formylglutamate amidohydrolase n=1 Tax=Rhodohalobacter halophilus TaxID=1812810 RepID=UPI00083FC1FD|nr:N-formylglutamate amidohydrolase [Rhodohalobacter halophilus]